MEQVQNDAKGQLDPGPASINICFSTTGALLSRTIRWFTGSLVSHSVITFRDRTLDRVMVMQASGHGYQIIPWARWEQANILIARFELPADVRFEPQLLALRAITRRIGDGYDARGLFGFLPVLWYRFKNWIPSHWRVRQQGRAAGDMLEPWRPRFHNWLDNPDKLFCSEAVAEFLGYANPDWKTGYFERPQDWSPENLLGFAGRYLQPIIGEDQQPTQDRQLELSPGYWHKFEARFVGLMRPPQVPKS